MFSEETPDPNTNLILQKLISMEANYVIASQPYPGTVSWQRTSVQHSVQEDELKVENMPLIRSYMKKMVSSCSNTRSNRDDPYWTSRENNLELIELSSINKVSLVQVSSCSNTRSIRDDPYWTSRKNSLEPIELSSINKVSLV